MDDIPTAPAPITVRINRAAWIAFVAERGHMDNALTELRMHLEQLLGQGTVEV